MAREDCIGITARPLSSLFATLTHRTASANMLQEFTATLNPLNPTLTRIAEDPAPANSLPFLPLWLCGNPADRFVACVTCPKGVHRTYYWSRRFAPPDYSQVTGPSFPNVWEGAMGKFSRSWQLVKQSFAILRSDKQLMLFPVFSAVACFIVTIMIATGGAFMLLPARAAALAAGQQFQPNQSPLFLPGMFLLYVVNYFII